MLILSAAALLEVFVYKMFSTLYVWTCHLVCGEVWGWTSENRFKPPMGYVVLWPFQGGAPLYKFRPICLLSLLVCNVLVSTCNVLVISCCWIWSCLALSYWVHFLIFTLFIGGLFSYSRNAIFLLKFPWLSTYVCWLWDASFIVSFDVSLFTWIQFRF